MWPGRLLAALLHVALHEVLGVGLEHVVDLVEQLVELGLDLLAALALGRGFFDGLFPLRRGCLLLLFSLCHVLQPFPAAGQEPSLSSSSAGVVHSSNNVPTWARVPRVGSIIGTRRRGSLPTSKTSESQFAATIEEANFERQRPRK
jgi:hypothetical protein